MNVPSILQKATCQVVVVVIITLIQPEGHAERSLATVPRPLPGFGPAYKDTNSQVLGAKSSKTSIPATCQGSGSFGIHQRSKAKTASQSQQAQRPSDISLPPGPYLGCRDAYSTLLCPLSVFRSVATPWRKTPHTHVQLNVLGGRFFFAKMSQRFREN